MVKYANGSKNMLRLYKKLATIVHVPQKRQNWVMFLFCRGGKKCTKIYNAHAQQLIKPFCLVLYLLPSSPWFAYAPLYFFFVILTLMRKEFVTQITFELLDPSVFNTMPLEIGLVFKCSITYRTLVWPFI